MRRPCVTVDCSMRWFMINVWLRAMGRPMQTATPFKNLKHLTPWLDLRGRPKGRDTEPTLSPFSGS